MSRDDLEKALFSEADRKRLFSGTSGLLVLVGGDREADLKRLDSGMRNIQNYLNRNFFSLEIYHCRTSVKLYAVPVPTPAFTMLFSLSLAPVTSVVPHGPGGGGGGGGFQKTSSG